MGDGSLKTVEIWRTGQGNLPILGSVDIMEYADISGRLGGTFSRLLICLKRVDGSMWHDISWIVDNTVEGKWRGEWRDRWTATEQMPLLLE